MGGGGGVGDHIYLYVFPNRPQGGLPKVDGLGFRVRIPFLTGSVFPMAPTVQGPVEQHRKPLLLFFCETLNPKPQILYM